MEWLKENIGVFIIIILIILFIITCIIFFILKKTNCLVKNTIISPLKEEVNIFRNSNNEDKEILEIKIYNTNFRDVIISSFGLQYKGQIFDFIKEYQDSLELKDTPVIPARSYINFHVDPLRVEDFVIKNNFNKKRISTIYNIVVDSVGNINKINNRKLTRVLRQRAAFRAKLQKQEKHEVKLNCYKAKHKGKEPFFEFLYRFFNTNITKIPDFAYINKNDNKNVQTKIKIENDKLSEEKQLLLDFAKSKNNSLNENEIKDFLINKNISFITLDEAIKFLKEDSIVINNDEDDFSKENETINQGD